MKRLAILLGCFVVAALLAGIAVTHRAERELRHPDAINTVTSLRKIYFALDRYTELHEGALPDQLADPSFIGALSPEARQLATQQALTYQPDNFDKDDSLLVYHIEGITLTMSGNGTARMIE